MCIPYRYFTAANVYNPPRRIAQLKHITRLAFDREVFIERADERPISFRDDSIIGHLRNGAARCDRRQPSRPPRPQAMVDSIAMQIRARPISWSDAIAQHPDNFVEVRAI